MKYDMAGAALVWGAACAIARLRLPLRLTVIAPLVRNDLSGSAVHVQDILRLRNGRTVEVANTDAEGRLILADALAIAGERRPDWILDAATLTGACVVALGEDVAGLFARDEGLGARLRAAGDAAGERFWPLPLYRPYAAQLKATVADGKNIGSRWGGAITAALFLEPFVPEKTPWLHLDIAGPGIKEEPLGCLGKGAKGFGIRAVVGLAGDLAATGAPRAGRKA